MNYILVFVHMDDAWLVDVQGCDTIPYKDNLNTTLRKYAQIHDVDGNI